MSWIDATRARWRLIFRANDAEARMRSEIEFHIAMETERLLRDEQLSPTEARRRALVAFGGIEKHKEELRSTRGLAWVSGLSLDLKLGFRMLAKYPFLTVVGCLAISTAIAICSSYFEILNDTIHPATPAGFDERIVRIRSWNVSTNKLDAHPMADFALWRGEMKTIENLGAFTKIERNLIGMDGQSAPSQVVAMSASAFRLVPVAPLLGRTLSRDDERDASPDVVVIGERIWRTRLHADSGIIGKSIRLGTTPYTVVGVMPASFGFPVNYSVWVPLRDRELAVARGDGPNIGVFGRLSDGISLEQAQAELSAIGQRTAAAFPKTNEYVRPKVTPYLSEILGGSDPAEVIVIYAVNVFLVLFLCVCATNVATLVFARTATREGEIAIRTSLGASRGRIVVQLFCEGFAMALASGIVGLGAAYFMARRVRVMVEYAGLEQAPFWWSDSLSLRTIAYAIALILVSAVLIGVIPALKATGRDVGARLKRAASGNGSMRFGRTWRCIVVAQVALTTLFLMATVSIGLNVKVGRYIGSTFDFETAHLLTYSTLMDGGSASSMSNQYTTAGIDSVRSNDQRAYRYQKSGAELIQRLLVQPGVTGASYSSKLPNDDQIITYIEVDGQARFANGDSGRTRVEYAAVGPTFFETLGEGARLGRTFAASDTISGRNTAIVDKRFVERVLGGRNPIGVRFRRVRYGEHRTDKVEFAEWREIVGVVNELSPIDYESDKNGVLYESRPLAAIQPAAAIVRVTDDPHRHIASVRQIAASVDGALQINSVMTFDETGSEVRLLFRSILKILAIIGAIALMLSTAGIHALMAFTVARRTREIGIRTALGAQHRDVVRDTFRRAFAQVGIGIVAGVIPGTVLLVLGPPEVAAGMGWTNGSLAAGAISVFVLIVTAVACTLPVQRALGIQPTEALRSEA